MTEPTVRVAQSLRDALRVLSRELPTDLTSVDDIREYRRVGAARATDGQEVCRRWGVAQREFAVDGASVTSFVGANARFARARVVFLHGGGLIAGSRFDGVDVVVRHAAELGLEVWTVEYPLAPEASFDRMIAIAVASVEAATADGTPVLLAGQSAGGAVAAATGLACRDRGLAFHGLMLICPMLSRRPNAAKRQFVDDPSWSARSNDTAWSAALEGSDAIPPGERVNLGGLPPTYLDCGSAELFRDDVVDFATRLWVHGISAELHVWSGAFHGSDGVAEQAAASVESHKTRREWLRRWIGEDL